MMTCFLFKLIPPQPAFPSDMIGAEGKIMQDRFVYWSSKDITHVRTQFEKPWDRLHTIRTKASVFASGLVFVFCLSG
jgi:hypothetical protein